MPGKKDWLSKITGELIRQANLKELSSYRIGGKSLYFSMPENLEQLKKALLFSKSRMLKPVIFGYGTNLLFPDGEDKTHHYISLRKFVEFDYDGDSILLSAGIPASMLAIIGWISDDESFYFSHLLPGSIGGAIFMNARCYNNEFCNILSKIKYLDEDLNIKEIEVSNCNFSYKKSVFQEKTWIILGGKFRIKGELPEFMTKRIEKFLAKVNRKNLSSLKVFYSNFRIKNIQKFFKLNAPPEKIYEIEKDRITKHHFDFPSCGSVFKNNYEVGKPIGRIVDELGLKGYSSGGAKISPYHGNFIINQKNASRKDVLDLIKFIQEKIGENFSFIPEPEVRIIENEEE